jgi:hypothetical protein
VSDKRITVPEALQEQALALRQSVDEVALRLILSAEECSVLDAICLNMMPDADLALKGIRLKLEFSRSKPPTAVAVAHVPGSVIERVFNPYFAPGGKEKEIIEVRAPGGEKQG